MARSLARRAQARQASALPRRPAILHVTRRLHGDVMVEIPLHDVQRELDARRLAARGVDARRAVHPRLVAQEMDLREARLEFADEVVMAGRLQSIENPGLREFR